MTISRKTLCFVYAAIGILAFVGTWGNILDSLKQLGFWGGTLQFWQDVLVNGPSRFITVDTLFLSLSIVVWMVLEARRLNIPGVWLYILFGVFIAISLAVPLFMIHRERRLAALEPGAAAGSMGTMDGVGILAMAVASTAFAVKALSS